MSAMPGYLHRYAGNRVLVAIVAVVLTALLTSCSEKIKPTHYGVFVKEGGKLIELTERELFETPLLGKVQDIDQIQSSKPEFIIWRQNTQLDYLDFYKLGKSKKEREIIKYNAKPGEDGVYEITPSSSLSDGEYCIVQGDPLGMFLPGWCFRIGAEDETQLQDQSAIEPSPTLSKNEAQEIKPTITVVEIEETPGKTTLRVATEDAYPPFEMVDQQTKELIGFDIELMDAIAEKAGFEIEYKVVKFDSVMAGIATCQFDAAISAIVITEERAKKIGFSTPYINAGEIITVRIDNNDITSPADLVGKTVGVLIATTGQIAVESVMGTTVKAYDSLDQAFLDLANGQMDAVVADYPTTLKYGNKFSDKIKTTGEVFTDKSYGIAVCKENTELLEKINKALNELKSEGFLTMLEEKWLAENDHTQ